MGTPGNPYKEPDELDGVKVCVADHGEERRPAGKGGSGNPRVESEGLGALKLGVLGNDALVYW